MPVAIASVKPSATIGWIGRAHRAQRTRPQRTARRSTTLAGMDGGRGSRVARVVIVAAASLALSACAVAREPGERTGGDYGSSANPPTLQPRPTKDGAGNGSGAGSGNGGAPTARFGKLAVTITSPSGKPLPGAVVAFTGPQNGTIVADASGVARRKLKPGAYVLDVQRCGIEVHVTLGAGADLTVGAGQTTSGTIEVGGWEPRYMPIIEVATPVAPPWRVGEPFTLKTRVGDRCRDDAPPKQAVTIDGWEYVTESPVRLAATPSFRTDGKGWLTARFVCEGAGDGDVAVRDPQIGTRYVPVLGAVPRPDGTTYCVN